MAIGNLKDKEGEIIELLQQVLATRAGWNEVVRSGAIAGLSQLKLSATAAALIQEYTVLGTPQSLRLAAIRGLGAVSIGQESDKLEAIVEQLSTISQETFFLTQVSAVSALGRMENSKALPYFNLWRKVLPMVEYAVSQRKPPEKFRSA